MFPLTVVLLWTALAPPLVENKVTQVNVTVPEFLPAESRTVLTCSYSLSASQWVDSIKWYLNTSEIYRIVPGLTHQDRVLTFPLECLTVSLAKSGLLRVGLHQLALRRVGQGCQGLYTCQVTTSSPPFYTGEAGAVMTVFLSPSLPPVVRGARMSYRLGESLELTCTSDLSQPPQLLHWTINGLQVSSSSHSVNWTDGLSSTTVSLSYQLSSPELGSPLEIVCTSTIPSVYSNKVLVKANFDGTVESVFGEALLSDSELLKLNLKMVKTISLLLLIIN